MAPKFQEALFACQDIPVVTDIRGYGLLGTLDLAPVERPGVRGYAVLQQLYDAGVMTKITGDSVLLSPPLVLEDSHIDEMFTKIRGVLQGQ
jgi:beta-alanine--pyruvate transaminase